MDETRYGGDWALYSMRSKVLMLGSLYVVSVLVLSYVSGPGIATRLKPGGVPHSWMDRLVLLDMYDERYMVWARINESYRDVRFTGYGWIKGQGWGLIGSATHRVGGWVESVDTLDSGWGIFWIGARTSETSSQWKLSPYYLFPGSRFSVGASTQMAISGDANRSRTTVDATFPPASNVLEAGLIHQEWYTDPYRRQPVESFVKMTDLGGGEFSASWEYPSGDRFLRYIVVGLTGSGEVVVSNVQSATQGTVENLFIEAPPANSSLRLVEKPLPLIRALNLALMLTFLPTVFWFWVLGRQTFAQRSRVTRLIARRGLKRALYLALLGWFAYRYVFSFWPILG